MIADVLIPSLRDAFPGRDFRRGADPEPIAVFPAAHATVGDVSVWDDGDEATVGVGEITHTHFNPYDPNLSPAEVERWVVIEVIAFLEQLFADRILLWKRRDGSSAGLCPLARSGLDDESELAAALTGLHADDVTYLWSGPVGDPKARSAG